MAYHTGAIEASLAAAIGNDQALIADLRHAFFSSAERHLEALRGADSGVAVRNAAVRLHSLAASFGAERLMGVLAPVIAAESVTRDDVRRVERALAVMKAR